MTDSYRFFLGYSRCNYPFAERLKADLAWAGINIFCDTTDIQRAESDWQHTIDAAIHSSKEFILLSSPEAEKSTELQREYERACALNKPISVYTLTHDQVQTSQRWRNSDGNPVRQIERADRYDTLLRDMIRLATGEHNPEIPWPYTITAMNFPVNNKGFADSSRWADAYAYEVKPIFTIHGQACQALPLAPSAYGTAFLICPNPPPTAVPTRLSVLIDFTPGASDTIEQVLSNHLAVALPGEQPEPWLLYIQGHRSRDFANLAKTKNKPSLSIPYESPHIWRDLEQLCETTLGQFTGQPRQIFDFYFRAPAAAAFQLGRLASSRQGGTRLFQYIYNES
ncbi:MAG: toll/interleukin-1 receptor domain-containing protein, partial [Cyanobacteriota bacterium]|nr:toll/interleukin-1 receptor domain-containing protein [Cyanobacteriota bacterium]